MVHFYVCVREKDDDDDDDDLDDESMGFLNTSSPYATALCIA